MWPVRTMLCAGAQSTQHRVCGRAWAIWPSELGTVGSRGNEGSSHVHLSPEQPLLLAYSAAVVHQGAKCDNLDVNALRHSGLVRDLVTFLRANCDSLNLRDCVAVESGGPPLHPTEEPVRGALESALDAEQDCILLSLRLKWLPDPLPPRPMCIRVAVTFEARTETFSGTDQSLDLCTLSKTLCIPQLGPALSALHISMLCDLMSKLVLQHGTLLNGTYIDILQDYTRRISTCLHNIQARNRPRRRVSPRLRDPSSPMPPDQVLATLQHADQRAFPPYAFRPRLTAKRQCTNGASTSHNGVLGSISRPPAIAPSDDLLASYPKSTSPLALTSEADVDTRPPSTLASEPYATPPGSPTHAISTGMAHDSGRAT